MTHVMLRQSSEARHNLPYSQLCAATYYKLYSLTAVDWAAAHTDSKLHTLLWTCGGAFKSLVTELQTSLFLGRTANSGVLGRVSFVSSFV